MKRSGFSLLLLTVCAILISTSSLFAQQQSGGQNSLLPEINPQDIEIRSEFSARFPGLRRQPILGFNPEPSIYQVSSDRQPFMETQEEVVANLPITDLSRPSAPPYNELYYEREINAFGRIGVGSFVSPEAELWGIKRFSNNRYLNGSLDYHSSNGHLDPENSSFRFFSLDGEYATKISEKTSLKVLAGGESSFNRLYQLENRGLLLSEIPAGPKKTYRGFNTGVALNNHQNSIEGWDADANIRWFDMTMDAGDIGGSATESVYNASFKKDWAGSRIQETYALAVSGKGGNYDLSSQNDSQNWMTLRAGGEYQRLLDYSTQVRATADIVYTSNVFENKVYPGFSLEAKHWIHDNLTLSGSLVGNPRVNTIEQLNQLNRFLNHETQLRHTYTVEGTGKLNFEYYRGSSFYAKVGYMQAQNYAYFSRTILQGAGTSAEGYYSVNYMDANRIKGEVGVTHQLVPEKFWINARAYVQKPKLDDGSDVPYEENWGLNSGVSAKFFQKLRMEAWADYVSERSTMSSTTLSGFLLVGGKIEIDITDRIGVYAKMLNLLSQEYEVWSGYQERPFQAYGGVTIKLN